MIEVELRRKREPSMWAFIDDADADLVLARRWYADIRPRQTYARANTYDAGVRGHVSMHTLITGWPYVDHKDHNGLNNQRTNLRQSDQVTNGRNARSHLGASSQFKGVSWCSGRNRWQVHVDRRYLGLFVDEIEAARVYDFAALEAYGEFAVLNFPVSS